MKQAECDVIGITFQNGKKQLYAADIAFHTEGLSYGNRKNTVTTILKKYLRTAMCLYGYFDVADADIFFISPKIGGSILNDIIPCMPQMQGLLEKQGFHFRFALIANDDFQNEVLNPVLSMNDQVSDTSELFLRSYQLLQMFQAGKGKHK